MLMIEDPSKKGIYSLEILEIVIDNHIHEIELNWIKNIRYYDS